MFYICHPPGPVCSSGEHTCFYVSVLFINTNQLLKHECIPFIWSVQFFRRVQVLSGRLAACRLSLHMSAIRFQQVLSIASNSVTCKYVSVPCVAWMAAWVSLLRWQCMSCCADSALCLHGWRACHELTFALRRRCCPCCTHLARGWFCPLLACCFGTAVTTSIVCVFACKTGFGCSLQHVSCC